MSLKCGERARINVISIKQSFSTEFSAGRELKMKRCPACQRTYEDDSLAFCLDDGSALVSEGSGASDLPATLIMADPRLTNPVRPETAPVSPVHTPAPPQAYTA